MKLVKRILKWGVYVVLIPGSYLTISFILTTVTIDRKRENQNLNKSIYLSTNGVHLDIIIPVDDMDSGLLEGIKRKQSDRYLSFGWGDENFYINTPTWGDLTFTNACKALFFRSSTLMHVTRYQSPLSDWVEIKISEAELDEMNDYLQNSFGTNESGMKILLKDQGYSSIDDFYKAEGSYSCFNTCNSWVNTGFKQSGLKSCLWTPFDFGLMNKYN